MQTQPQIPDRPIFIHSYLDEIGLDPFEFRVYAHIIRRVGAKYDGEFFASLATSAPICGMSIRKMQYCLSILCEAKLIKKTVRSGKTDIYRICQPSQWASKEEIAKIRQAKKPK